MVTRQQTLSLAGVLQCCILVQRMARMGSVDENNLSRMVRTALVLDSPDPEVLYGGTDDVGRGLRAIVDVVEKRPDPDQIEALRMTNSALQLQKSLRANEVYRTRLGDRLAVIDRDAREVPFPDELYFALNDTYADTLSPLNPRIVVNGAQGHLQNAVLVAKVRSALLAAVRNAYLWSQLGGRRWQLLFLRSRYANHARDILGIAPRAESPNA